MQATLPTSATAAQLAASITFLLSDDGTNVNGAILASGNSSLWWALNRATMFVGTLKHRRQRS